jgi:hypothetical protein
MSGHHTVIDGVIQHLSVSQVSTFNVAESGCELRWFYAKVMGRKEPRTTATTKGTEVHAELDHYLGGGQKPLGDVAAAGRRLLPAPGQDLLLEYGLNDRPRPPPDASGEPINYFPAEQSLVRAGGIGFVGFGDVFNPREHHVLPSGELVHEPGVVEVIDHKTTGDLKWAKQASELVKSTQMVGYGVFLAKKFPSAKAVRLSHIYYTTKGVPTAEKRSAIVTVAEVAETWQKLVEPVAEKMKVVAKMLEKNVEGNLNACGNYGGCPHKHYCRLHQDVSPFTRFKMGLLKNRVSAPAASAPTPTNGASTTPWIPPPPPGQQLVASKATQGQSYRFSTGLEGMFLSTVDHSGQLLYSFMPKGGGKPFPVGPDEPITPLAAPVVIAAPPPPPAPPVVAAPPPPPAPPVVAAPPPPPAPPVVSVKRDADAPPPPPPLTAAAAPKRGPGRPKKEEVASSSPATGLTLYVNAFPNGTWVDLQSYILQVTNELQEHFAVSDIRCAADDSPLAFAKWRGVLAAAVREGPPAPGIYVAFTKGNELAEIVATALGGLCPSGQFVRGV